MFLETKVFVHPNKKLKGYESLKLYLNSQGCELVYIYDPSNPVGDKYETIRITNNGNEIPVPSLKRAHSWAHQRNLLHMFYKRQ